MGSRNDKPVIPGLHARVKYQEDLMDSAAARPSLVDGTAEARAEGDSGTDTGLSRRDRDILAFERQWWQYAGLKEQAIKEMFDLSPTRYYQVLNNVIDNPAALAEDPLLVRRLRRLRSTRQKTRSARRLGFEA
jgi:hypothetical protein